MDIIVMIILSPLVWLIAIVASVTELFNHFTANVVPPQNVDGFRFLKQILGALILNFRIFYDSPDIFPRNLKIYEYILLVHQNSPVCVCVCVFSILHLVTFFENFPT